jgi:hypothetical protein
MFSRCLKRGRLSRMVAAQLLAAPASPWTSSRLCSSDALQPTGDSAVSFPSTAPPVVGQQPAVPLPGANSPGLAVATPSSGAMSAPATAISGWCNTLSDCVVKAGELRQQLRMQELGAETAQVITREGLEEYIDELKTTASEEVDALVTTMKEDQALVQKAGMNELRRSLYYAITLKKKDWIDEPQYQTMMKGLSMEFLRRDYDGALSADDVLFVSTHIVMSNYYNRHLWNRMEQSLFKFKTFENIDVATVKGLSTKLFRSRRDASKESLDVRRKILGAMSVRVGVLANDFELPALLGILQCYTQHDLMPKHVEPLALRAINHINDFTPQECAQLIGILRKWNLMRLEVCEKLVERITISEVLTNGMVLTSLLAIRTCFQRVSEGGRNAINAEPTKQKLRGLGEQVACRMDEVEFPTLNSILTAMDVVVQTKIFTPKKCLQGMFEQANVMIGTMLEGKELTTKRGTTRRPITAEEGRQLQGMLYHYGPEVCPELDSRLKQAFKAGVLPDESSVF